MFFLFQFLCFFSVGCVYLSLLVALPCCFSGSLPSRTSSAGKKRTPRTSTCAKKRIAFFFVVIFLFCCV